MELKKLTPVPFTFDVDMKAINADGATMFELGDGDLLIEGWGANYDLDREDEAFADGAFTRGIKTFLSGNAPLCYHHKMDQVIGRVISAEPVAGKGIKIRAVVDRQPENSPLRHIYEGIKKGRINGFSVGGIFKRIMGTDGLPRINDVDILEWSATPIPVGKGTQFSVIAGKALEFKAEDTEVVEETPEAVATEETPVPETPEVEAVTPVEDEKPEGDEAPEEVAPEEAPTLVTGEQIATGSITTEHLADELRSRFSELTPEADDIESIAQVVDKLDATLGAIAKHVHYQPTEAPEQLTA